jgi:hypothetical protein
MKPLTITRSIDCAEARAAAPATDLTPNPDAVLLASCVSAVRVLQAVVRDQQEKIAKLTRDVSYLKGVTQ